MTYDLIFLGGIQPLDFIFVVDHIPDAADVLSFSLKSEADGLEIVHQAILKIRMTRLATEEF